MYTLKSLISLAVCLVFFHVMAQPTISFTFDDGALGDRPGYPFKTWNNMLLEKLDSAAVKTIFFVAGRGKLSNRGQTLLNSWDEKGHGIANHTFSHPNYNKTSTSFGFFSKEILQNDAIIKRYKNYTKLFRFPYLKEGNTSSKIDSIRQFLKMNGYKNGYVTIDASDWYIDSRMIQRLRKDPDAALKGYRDYYLNHLWEKALFYEKLSYKINGRHIKHTLLLHHNLAAALFIDDLIAMFKNKGWKVVSAREAFKDPIYNRVPIYAGESLIYALARDAGIYGHLLRVPPEDSQYEVEKMNKLGL